MERRTTLLLIEALHAFPVNAFEHFGRNSDSDTRAPQNTRLPEEYSADGHWMHAPGRRDLSYRVMPAECQHFGI